MASNETQAVVEHHLGAFAEGIDALMMDYTDESVLISPDGTFTGADEIRGFLEAFAGTLPEGFFGSFKVTKAVYEGEAGYILWEAKPWIALGTDTFVVRNNKIALQTFAAAPGAG
jgi:hypothetical protein